MAPRFPEYNETFVLVGERMKQGQPHLRIYFATGVIGAKCEKCGWSAKTGYVPGETAHQTATREFGSHVCAKRPAGPIEVATESTLPLAKPQPGIPSGGEGL